MDGAFEREIAMFDSLQQGHADQGFADRADGLDRIDRVRQIFCDVGPTKGILVENPLCADNRHSKAGKLCFLL